MLVLFEHLLLVIVLVLVCYLTFDEEPMVDVTDLNFVNVALLVISLLVVCIDNSRKSAAGINANADRQVFAYVAAQALIMIIYFFAIWAVFFSHMTTPMLVDSVESANMWAAYFSTLSSTLGRPLALAVVVYSLLRLSASSRAWRLGIAAENGALLMSICGVWFAAWDLMGRGLSSAVSKTANAAAPLSARSASSMTYSTGDFEWHYAVTRPTVSFFVDFASLAGSLFTLLVFAIIALALIVRKIAMVNSPMELGARSDLGMSGLRVYALATTTTLICMISVVYLVFCATQLRLALATSSFSWL